MFPNFFFSVTNCFLLLLKSFLGETRIVLLELFHEGLEEFIAVEGVTGDGNQQN